MAVSDCELFNVVQRGTLHHQVEISFKHVLILVLADDYDRDGRRADYHELYPRHNCNSVWVLAFQQMHDRRCQSSFAAAPTQGRKKR